MTIFLSSLHRKLQSRLPGHELLSSMAFGAVLSLASLLLSLLAMGALRMVLPPSEWGPSAAAPLSQVSTIYLVLIALIIAPLYETFLGQILPIEILRKLRANATVCILAGAVVFGTSHYFNGGIAHAISSFCAGLVFSYGYVACRNHGLGAAYLCACTAHAFHNFVMIWVVGPFLP